MKTRNMPEKVTLRRARAYQRLTGEWPDTCGPDFISDTKLRKGRNHRLKAPMKFIGGIVKVKLNSLYGKFGSSQDLNDTDVYPGFD